MSKFVVIGSGGNVELRNTPSQINRNSVAQILGCSTVLDVALKTQSGTYYLIGDSAGESRGKRLNRLALMFLESGIGRRVPFFGAVLIGGWQGSQLVGLDDNHALALQKELEKQWSWVKQTNKFAQTSGMFGAV